ncbi:MAG: DNA-3-methyladenine glycosylase I [Oscillospiraceae bacterium]|nr:DNA-3-methyladenine glycosylase I [Oscillospiraceae bacterium]
MGSGLFSSTYLQAVGVVNDHIESCAFRGTESESG